MKWVTLKPCLVFNWVMLLGGFSVPLTVIQTVNLNSKFCSFQVRILIRKDNTDNKVCKKECYTKETRQKGIEKIKCCKFLVQFAGNLSERVSGKQSSLNLSIFLFFFFFLPFFFYRKVSEFFEFRVFFKVLFRRILRWIFSIEFSFSWIFSSRLSFIFISSETSFKKRVTKPICLANFSCLYNSVPKFVQRVK